MYRYGTVAFKETKKNRLVAFKETKKNRKEMIRNWSLYPVGSS